MLIDKKVIFFLILSLLLFNTLVAPKILNVAAKTDTIRPIADSYVSSEELDSNYGGDDYIRVCCSSLSYTGIRTGYLKFNIGDYQEANLSAKLKLYGFLIQETLNVSVHKVVSNSWDELNITYNNSPSYNNSLDSNLVAYEDSWYSWDIPIEENTIISLAIVVLEYHHTSSNIYFPSKDYWDTDRRPKLEINYNLPVGNDTLIGDNTIFQALFVLGFYGAIIVISFVALTKYRERKRYKSSSLYIRPTEKNIIQNNSSVNYCIYCGNALTGYNYCTKCGKKNK